MRFPELPVRVVKTERLWSLESSDNALGYWRERTRRLDEELEGLRRAFKNKRRHKNRWERRAKQAVALGEDLLSKLDALEESYEYLLRDFCNLLDAAEGVADAHKSKRAKAIKRLVAVIHEIEEGSANE